MCQSRTKRQSIQVKVIRDEVLTMLESEKRQLLDYLNEYYEKRDGLMITANQYYLILRIIEENPDKNKDELIPILTTEIDKYRKECMVFDVEKGLDE